MKIVIFSLSYVLSPIEICGKHYCNKTIQDFKEMHNRMMVQLSFVLVIQLLMRLKINVLTIDSRIMSFYIVHKIYQT